MMDLSVAVPSHVSVSAMQRGFLVLTKSFIDVVLFLTDRTFYILMGAAIGVSQTHRCHIGHLVLKRRMKKCSVRQ